MEGGIKMSWKNTLRKAPFLDDDYGQAQPTEDTHPEIVQEFEIGLELIKEWMDRKDIEWNEKIEHVMDELKQLQSQRYQAFFLKRPFFNKKIKKLEQEILQLNKQIRNRTERDRMERSHLAFDLKTKELNAFVSNASTSLNQSINDMLVNLGKEPEGTDFQMDNE